MKAKGKHYIEAMPDKLRQEWHEGQCIDLLHLEEHDYENFCHFLHETLLWANTRQGHVYWEDIANDDPLCQSIDKRATRSSALEDLGI